MSRRSVDSDEPLPTKLLLAVATMLLLGTVGAIVARPTSPEVSLQRSTENWPPAPFVQSTEEEPPAFP